MNSKNIINLIVLTSLLFCALNLKATNKKKDADVANPQSVVESRYVLNDNMFGKSILSGGITTGPEYSGGFGIEGMYEYRIADRFSIGLQADVYFEESSLSKGRDLTVGTRANYHLIKENRIEANNWDWYVGLDLGVDLDGVFNEHKDPEAYYGAHTGVRYKLNYRWLTFAEVGTRNASIGLALMF
ncbi:hypothetical protein ACT3CE_17780 [Marinifilum sp. RC60d5]|uniref:hypothetical protein n=1 Tax=Marinifilum sp. RC60d5 TaxID=3458414 RepID=UPI004036D715